MIHYLTGDATEPQANGARAIAHICNDKSGWGSGFVMCLSKKWSEPEMSYRKWAKTAVSFGLGEIQIVSVRDPQEVGPLYVVNMVAQHGYASPDNPVALRYGALAKCLIDLNDWVGYYIKLKSKMRRDSTITPISIHAPRLGAGLAGGSWSIIENLIESLITNCDVYVYDLERSNE